MRIGPAERFAYTFDAGSFTELPPPTVPADPLRFKGEKRYADEIKDARAKTGRPEAFTAARGTHRRPAGDDRRCSLSISWAARWAWAWARRWCEAMQAAVAGKAALHPVRLLGRRAHAGRHSVPDADAARHHLRRHAARGGAALYRGADRSHLRRRQRLLRHAGRYPDRRAGRADRLHRRPRHRPDHPRETARRLPARRISAGARHAGHGRASQGNARHPVAAAAYADETGQAAHARCCPCRGATATSARRRRDAP